MIDQIFDHIESKDISAYRIAKATGINESTLSRLKKKERFIEKDGLDRLLNYLGLCIEVKRSTKRNT